MEVHWLVALTVGARFNKSRTTALDLHSAASLLLDVLHISTTLPNDLSTQVEAGNWLKINGNSLIRPFALLSVSLFIPEGKQAEEFIPGHIHPARLAAPVPFYCYGIGAHQQGPATPSELGH